MLGAVRVLFAFLAALLVLSSTACSGDEAPTSTAGFCTAFNDDLARVAPFTPAGTEQENRARVADIIRAIERLESASPKAIRPRTSEVRDYAHRLKKVLDRTGYDLRQYNDHDPPREVLDVMNSSPMDALSAIKEFAASSCA